MNHTQGQEAIALLQEIAGHLNRVQTQQAEIISLLMLSNGLRPLNEKEREWLKACRREVRERQAA